MKIRGARRHLLFILAGNFSFSIKPLPRSSRGQSFRKQSVTTFHFVVADGDGDGNSFKAKPYGEKKHRANKYERLTKINIFVILQQFFENQ